MILALDRPECGLQCEPDLPYFWVKNHFFRNIPRMPETTFSGEMRVQKDQLWSPGGDGSRMKQSLPTGADQRRTFCGDLRENPWKCPNFHGTF